MATARATERLEARVTAAQKALLRQAADLRGVTLTDFLVNSAYEAAVHTLQATQAIELGQRDQSAFVTALLAPERPNRRLRAAAARHGLTARTQQR